MQEEVPLQEQDYIKWRFKQIGKKMMRKNKKVVKKKNTKVTGKSNVIDYNNDPFFIKKDEESVKFLEKHGFPEEYKKRK